MTKGLQMLSKISKAGELELLLADVDVPTPAKDQVVIRIEAAPIIVSEIYPTLAAGINADGVPRVATFSSKFSAMASETMTSLCVNCLRATLSTSCRISFTNVLANAFGLSFSAHVSQVPSR